MLPFKHILHGQNMVKYLTIYLYIHSMKKLPFFLVDQINLWIILYGKVHKLVEQCSLTLKEVLLNIFRKNNYISVFEQKQCFDSSINLILQN